MLGYVLLWLFNANTIGTYVEICCDGRSGGCHASMNLDNEVN